MSAELAPIYAQMMERSLREDDQFSSRWANVKDTATLARLSPLEAGARFLEAQDERYVMRLSRERDPNCTQAEMATFSASYHRDLLGVVARADTAFALHRYPTQRSPDPRSLEIRLARPPLADNTPLIITLIRANGVWRIAPRSELISRYSGSVKCTNVQELLPRDTANGARKPPN